MRWPPLLPLIAAMVMTPLLACTGERRHARTNLDRVAVEGAVTRLATSSGVPAVAGQANVPTETPALTLELPAIDSLVERALLAHKLPGCVIAIGRRDRVAFMRAYGKRALVPAPEPMTLDTLFDLASVTKPVATASAAFMLIERGALHLDDPVARYLPEVAPRARTIRVRDLLLHASGLPAEISLDQLEAGPDAARAHVLAVAPTSPRGSRFEYSDVGFIWLGEIVARAAGQSLDGLVRERLFAPLAMRDSFFSPDRSLWGRIAPTEITDRRAEPLIRGEVHDPRAYRLGGVAGNAGMFSTASDLARYARMLLGGGVLEGARVLSEQSVASMTQTVSVGGSLRTLGFDARSELSRARGTLLSRSAYGHGGHTGTMLWIDPEQDLFVIFLSNRVHPDGKGDVLALEAAITDAAVLGVARAEPCPTPTARVLSGIDVLREAGFARLRGKRVGLLTHRAARAVDGKSTLELLAAEPSFRLEAVLSPEHGLDVDREGQITDGALPTAQGPVPVHSLFGPTRRPTPKMLDRLDVLVIDLVDVGTRFYTYASTMREALIAAGARGLPVLLLDRPNPLGGSQLEGPLLAPGLRSFVNYHPLPLRHGLTLGELASLLVRELGLATKLEIVPARNWHRDLLFDQTGLTWNAPSPNLRSFEAALLYPAVGMLEGTELSVGRGTGTPFELVGAPFIDAHAWVAALRALELPGLSFEPASFTPAAGPFAGELCHGARVHVDDPRALSASRTAFALIGTLIRLHGRRWQREDLIRLLGDRVLLAALEAGADLERLARLSEDRLVHFAARRAPLLRYPLCRSAPQQPAAP